jgi:hypothetical protein
LLCSGTAHKINLNKILFPETQSHVRASAAGILRKPDTTVREELCSFNPLDRVLNQLTELSALFVRDRSSQVLNLNQSFANEDYLGNL